MDSGWWMVKDYKELEVWKKGILLVLQVYELIKVFPKEERYALTDQIKRAAVSIPSNIAEGASRNTTKEFVQFLYITLGSASELETQMVIAEKLCYMKSDSKLLSEITVIRKMLNALITSLKKQYM
ncbi:MAG TPA: four helix bundle protein [Smithellaceae bacterium]|nr:four helix bundle protein [Smithellaceae bacterium]